MKNKITVACLLLLFTITSNAQVVDSINPNFKSRFEYVTCRFNLVNYTVDDSYFSCHIKSVEDSKVYKIYIGINQLYRFLYQGRAEPSVDHLYASIGRMFIYDTICLSNEKIKSLDSTFIVNQENLDIIIRNGFYSNYLDVIESNENNIDCMSAELGYYFDRRYFRSGVSNTAVGSNCYVNFDYDCYYNYRRMPIPDWNDGINYFYDEKGVLIRKKKID